MKVDKNIVFVTGAMGRGGAERVISLLSDHYAKKGWSVTILMLLHNITDGYQLNPKVKIVDLSQKGMNSFVAIPFVVVKLKRYLEKTHPDVIVSFMAQNTIICGLATMNMKAKLITSERIDPSMVHRNIIYRLLLNKIYANCECTVMQTQRALSYFPLDVQKNGIIVPNPISVDCYAVPIQEKRIVTAGRLTKQKNHEMLINAFAEFAKVRPEYRLEIFGKGPEAEKLQNQIKKLDLENKVILRGSSSTLHNDIASAEMFVLSSSFEGLSNAMLEAMMMGLAVISTKCAGADEAIVNGENGILVSVDNQEEMTQAMLYIANNPNQANKLRKNARETASAGYAIDNVIEQWEYVIEGEK